MELTFQDEYLNHILELIHEYGWAVQGVGAGDGEPTFSYTVGLHGKGAPEFILFGLPFEIAQPILNDLAKRAANGTRFEHGQVLDDVLRGYPAMLLEVGDTTEHLTVANRIAEPTLPIGGQIKAWQVAYPDRDGLWPWEHGSRVAGMPVLGSLPTLN